MTEPLVEWKKYPYLDKSVISFVSFNFIFYLRPKPIETWSDKDSILNWHFTILLFARYKIDLQYLTLGESILTLNEGFLLLEFYFRSDC